MSQQSQPSIPYPRGIDCLRHKLQGAVLVDIMLNGDMTKLRVLTKNAENILLRFETIPGIAFLFNFIRSLWFSGMRGDLVFLILSSPSDASEIDNIAVVVAVHGECNFGTYGHHEIKELVGMYLWGSLQIWQQWCQE
ncbi:hypothetical protein BGX26_012059 [Mortierella sp. AD094]|nr:hypothetical protein BGX26_012059 [Mortierella sp. AD094]